MPVAPVTTRPDWEWLPLARGQPAEPVVREWLAAKLDCPAARIGFRRDEHGRPWLGAPAQGWDCNWSHSGNGLLIGLGAGVRVGVDLEWLRPLPRALEIAARFFTATETEWLRAVAPEDCRDAFVRLWCAKEAVLKAHGRGIAFGLDRLEFAPVADALALVACDRLLGSPAEWRLHELAPAPGYRAALAWRPI